jgi:hypothetical protein
VKIKGWKEKALSWAGKQVLIKVVAQAIHVFVMGCFDITKDICDQISTIIARYWWSNRDKDNKIHWLSWEKLIRPKAEGDWDSGTSTPLTWRCWQSKGGD